MANFNYYFDRLAILAERAFLRLARITFAILRLGRADDNKNRIIVYLKRKIRSKAFQIWYLPNHSLVGLTLTYYCNLKCYNCSVSSRQAPGEDNMTEEQVKKFINESIKAGRKWKRIYLIGGEPTLHPKILAILNLLLEYKRDFSPVTEITIVTNGFGSQVNQLLSRVPKDISIFNSYKKSVIQNFCPFNMAPLDLEEYKEMDFSKGCSIASYCGIGLNTYGYYPCSVAAGMDRVLGFNLGKKVLPSIKDTMKNDFSIFCRYCGFFHGAREGKTTTKEEISPFWKTVYSKIDAEKLNLTYY